MGNEANSYIPSEIERAILRILAAMEGRATLEDIIWKLHGNVVLASDAMTGENSTVNAEKNRLSLLNALSTLNAEDYIEISESNPSANPATVTVVLTPSGLRFSNTLAN